jgi:hypothetical protein
MGRARMAGKRFITSARFRVLKVEGLLQDTAHSEKGATISALTSTYSKD